MPKTSKLEKKEEAFQKHLRGEDSRGHHVDGCFYCGGDHPTDCCRDSERDEYWNMEEDSE